MKRILAVAMVLGLAGCATEVVPPSQATNAPAQRLLKYQNTNQGDGKLIVTRDSGMVGGGCYASVYLNGEKSAMLETKEKAAFNLSPGEWAVGANAEGRGLCSFSAARQERYITIKTGETKVVRVFTDADGNMDIRPTTLQ